jgi:hypothetical protein
MLRVNNQMFLKLGFLFSKKAAKPSAGPSLLNNPWKMLLSCSRPCSRVVSYELLIALFAASRVQEALLTKESTSLLSSASKLSFERRCAMLSLWAYSAVMP